MNETTPSLAGVWGDWTVAQTSENSVSITSNSMGTVAKGVLFFDDSRTKEWKLQVTFSENNNHVSTARVADAGSKLIWSDQTQWHRTPSASPVPTTPTSASTPVTKKQTTAAKKKSTPNNSIVKAPRAKTSGANQICHNCKATESPSWRKDDEGNILCNKWYIIAFFVHA
jgi:hypothetical protein